MKKTTALTTASLLSLAVVIVFNSDTASAIGIMDGLNAAHGTGTPTTLFGDSGVITTITNVMLFIAGALAVIMVIFGGLRYVTSGGNSANVTAARNTIIYAIVGLIISFLAFAAVNFILNSVTGVTSTGFTDV